MVRFINLHESEMQFFEDMTAIYIHLGIFSEPGTQKQTPTFSFSLSQHGGEMIGCAVLRSEDEIHDAFIGTFPELSEIMVQAS